MTGAAQESAIAGPAGAVCARPGAADERRLVRAARRGSREAAEALAAHYWDDAYRSALLIVRDREGAEDVAQEAIVAALRSLPRFRPTRRFGPWLHRIAVNRALDWRRARLRRAEVELTAEPAGSAAERADGELPEELARALAGLSDEDRAIVVLRHLFDYRATEIAAMLGMRASTVRTRLERALRSVREMLEEGGP